MLLDESPWRPSAEVNRWTPEVCQHDWGSTGLAPHLTRDGGDVFRGYTRASLETRGPATSRHSPEVPPTSRQSRYCRYSRTDPCRGNGCNGCKRHQRTPRACLRLLPHTDDRHRRHPRRPPHFMRGETNDHPPHHDDLDLIEQGTRAAREILQRRIDQIETARDEQPERLVAALARARRRPRRHLTAQPWVDTLSAIPGFDETGALSPACLPFRRSPPRRSGQPARPRHGRSAHR